MSMVPTNEHEYLVAKFLEGYSKYALDKSEHVKYEVYQEVIYFIKSDN